MPDPDPMSGGLDLKDPFADYDPSAAVAAGDPSGGVGTSDGSDVAGDRDSGVDRPDRRGRSRLTPEEEEKKERQARTEVCYHLRCELWAQMQPRVSEWVLPLVLIGGGVVGYIKLGSVPYVPLTALTLIVLGVLRVLWLLVGKLPYDIEGARKRANGYVGKYNFSLPDLLDSMQEGIDADLAAAAVSGAGEVARRRSERAEGHKLLLALRPQIEHRHEAEKKAGGYPRETKPDDGLVGLLYLLIPIILIMLLIWWSLPPEIRH
jgi:hypothetical protein